MIVALTKTWLTNVTTLESLSAQTDPSRSRTANVDGQVRKYAGGRMRSVGSLGTYGTWKFTLVEVTQAQVEKLEAWMGQGVTVLVRDHRGQSMYGTFYTVTRTENMGVYPNTTYRADVEIARVDVVEGV